MGFNASITAFFTAIANIFKHADTAKEHQSESQIISDRKKLKKAVNLAERIFVIIDSNMDKFNSADKRKLSRLMKEFNKYD